MAPERHVLYVGGARPAELERRTDGVTVRRRGDAASALDALADVDCVVAEYGVGALDLLETVRETRPDLPFVVVSGDGAGESDDAVAPAAFAAGATDHVRLDGSAERDAVLAHAVTNAIVRARHADRPPDDRYRRLVEAAADPMFVVDDEARIEMVNEALVERYGYDRETLLGGHLTDFIPESAFEQGTNLIVSLLRDGERDSGTFEFEGEDADGEPRVAEVNVTVLTDDDGEYTGAAGVLRDVTERDRRERELDQYRTLVETVGDPMYRLDDEGVIRMVNDAMVAFTGYDRETLRDSPITEYLSTEDVESGEAVIEDLLTDPDRDRETAEFTVETAEGEARIVEVSIAVLTDGEEFVGSVGVVRDITERKERERELAHNETLIETVPVGLFSLDDEGVITWANEEFYETLDMTEDELVGREYLDLVAAGYFDDEIVERYLNLVRDMLSSSTDTDAVIHDVRVHLPNGETRIYDAHTGLLPLEDGEFQGTVTAFRDVTKQKTYERELERQNERLERFASLVSHDLRNPLNVAQGHLQVATEKYDDESLEEVGTSLNRMSDLIEDLLALARQGESVGETEVVEVDTVAEKAWQTVDTVSATLVTDAAMTVEADEGRLRQLFENCFRNAIEHAGEDVTVRVGELDNGDGFYVEDDGPGIPDDRKDQVLELGYTTNEDGTGFGLGIVTEIAGAHGWEVDVTDGTDGGARFEITGVVRVRETGDGE